MSQIFSDSTFSKDQIVDLSLFERKVFSQNGEDGVLEKIFSCIGVKKHYFVEFGVETGYECNARLLRESGWSGLMMDGIYKNECVNHFQEFISAENINDIFRKYHVPYEFDLLSIDIDYNDFHVWNAIEDIYSPSVVVIEYNASLLAKEDKVALYSPFAQWDRTNYYGASITALYQLGKKKGYSLVYAENRGVNLFFIRNEALAKSAVSFKDINDVEKLFKKALYHNGPHGGHDSDPMERSYIPSSELLIF